MFEGQTQRCLYLFICVMVSTSGYAKNGYQQAIPEHLSHITLPAVQNISIPTEQLIVPASDGSGSAFSLNLQQVTISIELPLMYSNEKMHLARHADFDRPSNLSNIQSFSASFEQSGKNWTLLYTQGTRSGFGELFGNGQHLVIEQRKNQVVVIDVGIAGLTPRLNNNDVMGELYDLPAFTEYALNGTSSKLLSNVTKSSTNEGLIIVDVMLLYTRNIIETFPDDMTQTLLQHLVYKANQTLFDSQIDMRLRLVHTEFVDYPDPSSIVALNQLRDALDGSASTPTEPSLANIAQLRRTHGADIVSMIRTHDLNEREVCGIAMFPNPSLDFVANVSNVGISGGSNCMDTFTHEIGHNFGAGHQRVNDISQGAQPAAGALVVRGKFNTLMSSIGTGDVNRDFGLAIFSNPDITCASVACGDIVNANNAATVNSFAQINASLSPSASQAIVASISDSPLDSDGDGLLDRDDAFPFYANETIDTDNDGVGDNQDEFPNDPSEQLDTDNDGTGNNADLDDDDDGTNDAADDLPLDAANTQDNDGDGAGLNSDALDNNFQEVNDNDQDSIGDRSDVDDDNDGVPDYYLPNDIANTQAWVVSAGTDNILRYNSQTGDFIASLLAVENGGFSFRSDAILNDAQQLFFISFSDVLAFDRQTNSIRKVIDRSVLETNFPVHLAMQDSTTLFINNGLGTSNIQPFNLLASGNTALVATSDSAVWRDIAIISGNRLLTAVRSANTLVTYQNDNMSAPGVVFSAQGLDKPEHIAIDGTGNVYVTNAGGKDVSRFDSNGNFLGTFIAAGSGGLGTPGCIAIGPDTHIYICSSNTHEVLKYDGQTGAFLNVFIAAAEGGLHQPVSIVFAGNEQDEFRLNGEHDSDGDLVNNIDDAFPLDASETIDTDSDGTGNNADLDDDNDVMPDTYELANNLNPLDASDASTDNDSDGSSNLVEFRANTNPNDAASVPQPVFLPVPPDEPQSSGGGSMSILLLLLVFGTCKYRRYKQGY